MSDDLAERARAGDRGALNTLLEQHLNAVYRYVSVKIGPNHPDLDDVVQDTLIGAARSIRSLRGTSDPEVVGWMLSIARHKVADRFRALYRQPHDSLEGVVGAKLAARAQPVDELIVDCDRAERLRKALRALTTEQEEVLILRFLLGFGIAEVAEITGRPSGAVKSMQHRALATLQEKLGSESESWN
ncbi:MAG TPA: RNA polymerase sigma factor [Candidatus Dormibacteraeota bacterium]|nr:RNA polymerase sigma factor [Candidatus Dormibacteraeota bacterium]